MAEEEKQENGEEVEGGESEGGSSSKKLIIIIVIALILIGGAGAAAFFLVGGEEDAEAGKEEVAEAGVTAPIAPPQVFYYEMPDILVNLSSSGHSNRYLKMKVSLELGSQEELAAIETVIPRVLDDFQLYLRQLRVDDVSTPSGAYRVKESLLVRANQQTEPIKVKNVLFREFIVQ